jgi:hypothetical protein
MHFDLLAMYAGPDQVMTVTSGLASVIGVLLIFWNKTVARCLRVLSHLRNSPERAGRDAPNKSQLF